MKKIYLKPSMEVVIMGTTTMICGSQDITSTLGIDYGGIDISGEKDPASRLLDDDWDFEEEENFLQ